MYQCLITVLMGAYNAEKYLYEAVDSILNQTFRDFEFIAINDGSTDSTGEILNSYSDTRVIAVHNSMNMGLIATLNHGLELARGKYIVRMDADDIAMPTRLEKLYHYMEKNPECGVCGSAVKQFGETSKSRSFPRTSDEIKTRLLWDNSLAHPSVIMRREFFIKHKLFYRPDYPHAEDYRMWTECACLFPLANLGEPLLKYRVHNSQIGATQWQNQRMLTDRIRLKYAEKNLNFSFKELEESPHLKLANCPRVESESELTFIARWIENLITANSITGAFNNDFFNRQIAKRWVRLCRRSSLPRRIVWPIFASSPLSSYCTITEKASLLLPRF